MEVLPIFLELLKTSRKMIAFLRGIYVPSTTFVLVFMLLSYNIKISLVVDDTVNFNLSSLKFNLSWCDY